MSVSPSVQAPPNNNDGERNDSSSPYFPRISGANTIARPSPSQNTRDEAFPSVKLQAKMVKQTPLPYQTQEFRPCIVLKKFEPSVRVSDNFVPGIQGDDVLGEFKKKRTVILHTDRYTHHGQMKLDADSQKVRLAQEGQMLQDARSRMRLREALAHRARHDLHLGGSPVAAGGAIESAPAGEQVGGNGQRHRRFKKPRQRRQQQQQLGLLPEDANESSLQADSRRRRRQRDSQATEASGGNGITPPLHLGQRQHQHQLQQHPGGQQSFVSRSELEAFTALISDGESATAMPAAESGLGGVDAFGGSGGLEKVKLDGCKAVFNRRSDILEELTRLKAIALPDFAKDLYVGRGIRLPGNHALNNPKKTLSANDPVLDALLHRAQQPTRIIDESGNVLISSTTSDTGHQQGSVQRRQVFAADVTAKPKKDDAADSKAVDNQAQQTQPKPAEIDERNSEHLQQQTEEPTIEEAPQPKQREEEEATEDPQLPEPFEGLPSEWMRESTYERMDTQEAGAAAGREEIRQLGLPPDVAAYLQAILAASRHSRARSLTLELGRLIEQRLLAGSSTAEAARDESSRPANSSGLIGWLRRGLDLFHDVDREGKGSVSLVAFFDILSSMRGMPIENEEAAQLRDVYGLSGDSVSKLAFLTVLPFLQNLLNRKA